MNSKLGFVWAILAAMSFGQLAAAQPFPPQGGPVGPVGGYDQGGFQPMMGDFQVGMPGRLWFETNIADRGLGYQGSYLTLGGKTRLYEDYFDGRWLLEMQGHYALEEGGFFGNLGLERVFSIDAAGADFTMGAWADYDGDEQGDFAHSFTQVGINAGIKSRRWDLIANGYIPVGTTDHAAGDPTGAECFLGNNIVVIPGIDSALEGFDVTLRTRPAPLAFMNGTVDFGGYGYGSDLVDFFGGGRARFGFQILRGMIVNAEVNHDDRFDTTGVLQLAWIMGANARGNEYSPLGRDLEPTLRNDHIVRFQQDLVLAIDPDTGLPYNVIHVDNTADPAFADGTVRTPFRSLADAEAASIDDDIIFVREGDGTTAFYNTGITLKNGQLLLGDGVQHLIPIQNGVLFELCNDQDGIRPRITDNGNGPAVQIFDRNTVRGFVMDGSNGTMGHGIFGDGALQGSPIDGGIIEDNEIFGAVLHGVGITDHSGDWRFARNNVHDNGFDGILLEDGSDPTARYEFEDNIANNNGRHGIQMQNWDAATVNFLRNQTNGNGGDGVRMEDFLAGAGQRASVRFAGHEASGNAGNGINVINGDGDLRFLNSLITNNNTSGIRVENWTNTDPRDVTLIGTTPGGTSTIAGNFVGIDVLQGIGTQTLRITDSTVDNNGVGIRAAATGIASTLNTNIFDNLSVSNNLGDGMRFRVTGGALHNVVVEQPTLVVPGALPMLGNGSLAGDGIRFLVGDGGPLVSTMNALVQQVNIQGTGGDGISSDVIGTGNLQLIVRNSTIDTGAANGVRLNIDNTVAGSVNSILLDGLTITDHAANGVSLTTGDDTFTDLLINNTVISNTAPGGLTGVTVNAFGLIDDPTPGVDPPVIDNRTRVIMAGSIINNFAQGGFSMLTDGDARGFAQLVSNQIFNNGQGVDGATLPFFDGILIGALGESVINTRLISNIVTGNFEQGLLMGTGGFGTVNALLVDNNFAGNDVGEDTANDPTIDSNITDAIFTNATDGMMCVAMSSNNFLFNPQFLNAGAPANFIVALDGITNGFAFGAIGPGTVSPGVFGTTCEVLIDAEELAFIADGFPPQ